MVQASPDRSFPAGSNQRGRAIRAAVVDDEDSHDRGQFLGGGKAAASGARPVEIAEQLVQRGTEAVLLVVRGQDDGERVSRHGGQSRVRASVRAGLRE